MVHLLAKTYGWTLEEISELTPLQIRFLLECIQYEAEVKKKYVEEMKDKKGLR